MYFFLRIHIYSALFTVQGDLEGFLTTTCTMHDEAVRCLAIIARRKAQIQVAIQPSHLPFSMVVGRATTSLHGVIGTAIAKGVAMRLMGLDTIRHLGNPPTRGWFT